VSALNTESMALLQEEITNCAKCPRLVAFREKVAREKRKEFSNFEYWGRPVPSWGKSNARLIIIGLAPAAHGGNRTGRMFTGDSSSRFLFRNLYRAGFALKPESDRRGDGNELVDCYITASVHCVPPENKPTKEEMKTCSSYLTRELTMLPKSRAIFALGKIAFDSVVKYARERYEAKGPFEFHHGRSYQIAEGFPLVFASYHPSPRNTNTGKLTDRMFQSILLRAKKSLEE
jgi:uracil-DNA glycosylase family 4